MATYIQGLTQYLPQIQPFQRDFNFYANVMQKKQTEYDSGHEAMNKLYGSIFYSDVSRTDMKERKEELLKAIDFNLKKASTLDLSLKQNQRQAQQVFRPFYEDSDLMKDIAFTKTYQNEVQRGLAAKDCVGKDCPETYWDGGIRLLEHQMNRFKNVSLEEARQMRNPSYTPHFNIMKEGAKLIKENGFEIVRQGPQGGYMVKEKNGPNAIMSFNDFLFQNFSSDPRAIDFYNAKAQLSFYDNPEETINQYELLKLKQRAKDEEDYKNLLQEHKKEKEFNTAKRNINGAAKLAQDNYSKKRKERMVFQDYANQLGELFTNHPAEKDLNDVIREEETLEKTASELNNLKDNIYGVSYIDKETGQRVSEHVITSVVAQGMLVNETLGVAQSIAMNTYQQTVTGSDPYALARYKNRLAKELEEFKTDQQMMRSLFGGTGSSKSKTTGLEIDDKEQEKIRKKIKKENSGLNDEGVDVLVQQEILEQKTQKGEELVNRLVTAVNSGSVTPSVLENVVNKLNNNINQHYQLNQILKTIAVNKSNENFIVKESSQDGSKLNALAKVIQDFTANKKRTSVDPEGNIEKNPITFSYLRDVYENVSGNLLSVFDNQESNIRSINNQIGESIKQAVVTKLENIVNLEDSDRNALELFIGKIIDDPDTDLNTLSIELTKLPNEKFAEQFIEYKKDPKLESLTLDKFLEDRNSKLPGFAILSKYAVEKAFNNYKEQIPSKPEVNVQIWNSLGLDYKLLKELVLNTQQQQKNEKHFNNFNKQNKAALELIKNNWLNLSDIDPSSIKAKDYRNIDFSDNSLEKTRELNKTVGNLFYSGSLSGDNLFYSGGLLGGTGTSSTKNPKNTLKQLLLNIYPSVEKVNMYSNKPVTQISTFNESLEQFVNEHVSAVADKSDDTKFQVSNFLHDLMHIRTLNPRPSLTGIKGYVSEDEALSETINKTFIQLSEEAQEKAFMTGLVREENNKLYFHDLLIDLTPTDETKSEVLHNQLKALSERGSQNNVYAGFVAAPTNDWTNAGMDVDVQIKLNDYGLEEMSYLENVLNSAQQQVTMKNNLGVGFNGTKFPILSVEGRYKEDLTYGDKIYSGDEAYNIINSVNNLIQSSTLSNIAKQDATKAPEIRMNTITVSDKGSQYATVEINLTGNSSAVLEKFNLVKENDYNTNDKIKKTADDKGYTIVPDKFSLTIPINDVPQLQKAAVSRDVIGLETGDVLGDLRTLGYQTKVKNVSKDYKQNHAPTLIEFEVSYISFNIDRNENGVESKQAEIKTFPGTYTTDSAINYNGLMRYIFEDIEQIQKNN